MQELSPSYYFDLSNYKHAKLFSNIDHVWDVLLSVSTYLRSNKLGVIEIAIPPGVHLVNPELISIAQGTIVEPGAYIKGPCLIGENCTIRHGAYIRGDLICGNHCVIGHDTEIKNSILLDHAHAAHFAYVGDSVLGNKVNLGAGTKCANLKLDNGPVSINFQGKHYPTGLRKFGAIIGDGVQIGCNAVTNPGTLIGKNSICHPCLNIRDFIPANHIVKNGVAPIICERRPKETK